MPNGIPVITTCVIGAFTATPGCARPVLNATRASAGRVGNGYKTYVRGIDKEIDMVRRLCAHCAGWKETGQEQGIFLCPDCQQSEDKIKTKRLTETMYCNAISAWCAYAMGPEGIDKVYPADSSYMEIYHYCRKAAEFLIAPGHDEKQEEGSA